MGRSGPGHREPGAAGDALWLTQPLPTANWSAESRTMCITFELLRPSCLSPPSILSSSWFHNSFLASLGATLIS